MAEGIEDATTAEALHDLGYDIAQGFHCGRPMSAGDLRAWMRRGVPAAGRSGAP